MKKKALVMLTALTLATCAILTGCSAGKDYDYQSNDLSAYISLPEDFLTRDYKAGLILEALPTDADVDKEIKEVMEENFTEPVDLDENATVQDGDTVTIDYKGILAGETEPFEGGSANDYKLKINIESPSFIEGFEKGLIGWKAGQTDTLNLKFPDPYSNSPDLAGKEVNFTVTVDKIERTTVKELTDTLVAENPDIFDDEDKGITTVAAYREHILEHLSEKTEENNNSKIINAIYKYAQSNATFTGTYPDGLLNKYINIYVDYYTHTVAAGNTETVNGQSVSRPLTLKQYVKSVGYSTVDAFKEAIIIPQAEKDIKEKLVLYYCAQLAGVKVTDEEATKIAKEEYQSIVDSYTSMGLGSYLTSMGLGSFDGYITNAGGIDTYKEGLVFDRTFAKLAGVEEKAE